MSKVVTVEQCWRKYVQEHIPKTVKSGYTPTYWDLCLHEFGHLDASKSIVKAVEAWTVRHKRKGRNDATLRRYLNSLRASLNYAERHGLIDRAPIVPLPPNPPPRMRYLTREECKLLLDTADKSGNWRKRVFVRLALGTGQRSGAIMQLTWKQVNMKDGIIDFRAFDALAHRRKRRAVVPINEMVSAGLAIARQNQKCEHVIHRWGRPLDNPKAMVRELAAASGIKGLTAHVLRHTVASLLLQGGADILQVSRLLGHADSSITERVYFQHPPSWLKNLTDGLKF